MAAGEAFDGQPGSGEGAMRDDGFRGINRTSGGEAAAAAGAKEIKLRGRHRAAINANCQNQGMLEQIHDKLDCFSKPARRNDVKKSCSTRAKSQLAIEGRATSTSSTGLASSF